LKIKETKNYASKPADVAPRVQRVGRKGGTVHCQKTLQVAGRKSQNHVRGELSDKGHNAHPKQKKGLSEAVGYNWMTPAKSALGGTEDKEKTT